MRTSDREIVHTWNTQYEPGMHFVLLENGNLLRAGKYPNETYGTVPGMGVILQEIAPDGNFVWEYVYSDDRVLAHHDIEVMPNGNILIIAWEIIDNEEVIENGRNPEFIHEDSYMKPDHFVELKPLSNNEAEIVWEWRAWDHLVQDFAQEKLNYGEVSKETNKINVNFPENPRTDWNHVNSIDYNEELDQIIVGVNAFHEVWVIDHSSENKGIVGRYGNPATYKSDKVKFLLGVHDVEWIEEGLPGEGNILLFNNGGGRYPHSENVIREHSIVEEYRIIDEYTLEKV